MMPPVKEPLAGLALLVIFGVLIWYNRPIENPRPFDPYLQHQTPRFTEEDAYEAWLWRDPFEFDPAAGSGGAAEAWAWAAKREKSGINFESPVPGRNGEKKKPDHERQNLTCQVSLKKILEPDKKGDKKDDEGKPVILAPLVKVTPDTVENKEMRTRQRYAVVAGLIESGYRPQEPGLLHFCSIQKDSRGYDMRWEHYRHESKDNSEAGSKGHPEDKPDIVVAWIDSEILTAENKFPAGHQCTDNCNFTFKNLLKELSKNNKFYLFDLNNILGHNRSEQIKDQIKCINEKNKCDKKENIKLIKPAEMEGETGNEKLAGKLAEELKLRGIKDASELIIITEQGSENAATLASNVRQSLGKSFAKPGEIRNVFYLKSSDGNPKKTGNQDKKAKNETRSADKVEQVPVIDLHHSPPLSVGPGQLDYFHRLAEEIKNVHNTVDFDKRDSGAKAVVILGSDFNDKLLIIEILREKMPHILILTTDLDAQMLHRKHWRSTRNLVVASHFDLLLPEKPKDDDKTPLWQRAYQDQFPPFRDSQQTNIFYFTLGIAAGDAQSIEKSNIPLPQIFEVGRNGFVRLGPIEENQASGHPPPPPSKKDIVKRLGLLLGIALSLIGFHYAIRPWSRILSWYLSASTFAIFAIAFFFGTDILTNKPKEPLSFTDGVSLWPTLFIQIIAILLAVAFFIRAICELDENFCSLSRRYFPSCLPPFTVCPDKNGTDKCEPWSSRLRKLRPWLSRQITQRSLRGWPFIVLAVTVSAYACNDVYPSSLSFWPCFLILVVFAIRYIYVFETKDYVSIKLWIEKDDRCVSETDQDRDSRPSCRTLRRLCIFFCLNKRSDSSSRQENYEDGLWREYYNYGLLGRRITRVVWIWLIFAIIETLLVYLLPPWPLPWRGATDPASRIDMAPWTGVISFTITMLLLFFILDAVRLNFCWIKKLRTQHPLIGRMQVSNVATEHDSLRSLENIVLLIAERTRAVDKLIYYPMLCIMLMLFAKITYFDNQEFPLSKGITFGAAISFLFFSGFMLRHEANQLRLSIRKSVRDIGKNNNYNYTEKIIGGTVKRIDAIDEGAFQPMLEQPVMQALLMILASIGLFAGEYLKLFG